MICSVSEIAKVYNVSKQAVSSWGLQGEKRGRSILIDTQLPINAEKLSKKGVVKGENIETQQVQNSPQPPQNTGNRAQTEQKTPANIEFSAKSDDFEELQEEKLREEIKKLKIDNETSVFRFEVEKEKIKFENEILQQRQEKIKLEKIKIEKETQKIEIELKNYLHTDIIQSLLESGLQKIMVLEDEIIESLNYQSELQGEKIYEIRKIFEKRIEDLVSEWELKTNNKYGKKC